MNIVTVYIFPLNGAGQFFDLALNFIDSYKRNPAGIDHQVVVICNGSPVTDEAQCLFGEIPNCQFLEHDNSGYDIGGFQKASREVPADLMVFFGATAYIKRPNWLLKMNEARSKHGDTLYGSMGNRGHETVGAHPHVRTTGFWLSPSLFNQYPHKVTRPEHRYEFEHGATCLTTWVRKRGLTPWVVAGTGAYRMDYWDLIPNGYHQGDQSNLLTGDRLTRIPYGCDP